MVQEDLCFPEKRKWKKNMQKEEVDHISTPCDIIFYVRLSAEVAACLNEQFTLEPLDGRKSGGYSMTSSGPCGPGGPCSP